MNALNDIVNVVRGDITKVKVDAIVNAANTSLMGGGGVDGAIHRAGGPEILEGCRKIIAAQGKCNVGEAVITTAGKLPAKYVIHTVGPVWNGGQKKEREKLAMCYSNALTLAEKHECKSISFPSISTGIYKFPKKEAAKIAVATVLSHLKNGSQLESIVFVCFDDDNYNLILEEMKD